MDLLCEGTRVGLVVPEDPPVSPGSDTIMNPTGPAEVNPIGIFLPLLGEFTNILFDLIDYMSFVCNDNKYCNAT